MFFLQSLRLIALLEGISYLVLLFIAMPVRFFYENEIIVPIVGKAHGMLFIAYCILLLIVFIQKKWKFTKGLGAFIASFIPFGTFYADKKWFKPALNS